jgi:membrane fusion protein, multidrug efflux system
MKKKPSQNLTHQTISIILWPFRRFKKLTRRGKIITLIIFGLTIFWRVNVYINSGLEVNVGEAKYDKIIESVNVSGEVTAENLATLSFQTAGEVTEVNFKEGDYVKKGDIIAKLDTTLLYYNYKIAEAGLRSAQASLDNVYDQLQGHDDDETFAQRATRTAAETAKDSAYWAYAAASKNLEGAIIKTPFDGILIQAPANIVPGSLVSIPSGSVFQVVGPETTYFRCSVNEIEINKISKGVKAEIEIDAHPGEIFEGKVIGHNFASTTTITGGTVYVVRVSLPNNQDLKFKPGMNGDVNMIISEKENVLIVPITSVMEEKSESYVWVIEDRKAKKRIVETGVSSINDIEILSGLDAGETVVVRPPARIEEGLRLKILK